METETTTAVSEAEEVCIFCGMPAMECDCDEFQPNQLISAEQFRAMQERRIRICFDATLEN